VKPEFRKAGSVLLTILLMAGIVLLLAILGRRRIETEAVPVSTLAEAAKPLPTSGPSRIPPFPWRGSEIEDPGGAPAQTLQEVLKGPLKTLMLATNSTTRCRIISAIPGFWWRAWDDGSSRRIGNSSAHDIRN
jgi:hypothetical protein